MSETEKDAKTWWRWHAEEGGLGFSVGYGERRIDVGRTGRIGVGHSWRRIDAGFR